MAEMAEMTDSATAEAVRLDICHEPDGSLKPVCMTHFELVRDLQNPDIKGARRAALIEQAHERMRQWSYPRFPAACELPKRKNEKGVRP